MIQLNNLATRMPKDPVVETVQRNPPERSYCFSEKIGELRVFIVWLPLESHAQLVNRKRHMFLRLLEISIKERPRTALS